MTENNENIETQAATQPIEKRSQSKTQKIKKEKTNKKFSIWKILFLLLLVFNLASLIFVAVRVTSLRDEASLSKVTSTVKSGQKLASISSTTDSLNQVINSYLDKNQSKDLTYKFYISDRYAVFNADYKILGTKVPLYIYFEPVALSDGSICLSVSSISAGTLSLPTSEVLLMAKSYKLPAFVEVKSSANQIILHLNKIEVGNDLFVKANQIDLPSGKFTFDLMKKD